MKQGFHKEIIYMGYEEVACNFIDWLVENEYSTFEEGLEDQNEMVEDFMILEEKVPRLFNLLRDITDR